MNFFEALARLELWVSLKHAERLTIDQAAEMMAFVARLLRMQSPAVLPQVRLDTGMTSLGQFIFDIQVVALKRWNGGCFDQGVLVHELAHYVQQFNDRPFCEKQAIEVQCRWLQSIGAYPEDYPSAAVIFRLTGDRQFAKLDWLEAA